MQYERKSPYAGSIRYQPRTTLSPETLAGLRRELVRAGLVQEPENAAIVIDWYYEAREAGRAAGQRYVVLYRDGGDGEEPACLFYRKDVDRRENRTSEWVHIPAREDQPRLTGAWQWLADPSGRQLAVLTEYLDSIIDADLSWQPFQQEEA